MLRSAVAQRSLLRVPATTSTLRTVPLLTRSPAQHLCTIAPRDRRPQPLGTLSSSQQVWGSVVGLRRRYAMDNIDKDREAKIGEKKLHANPALVSGSSSTHPLMAEIGQKNEEKKADKESEEGETDMMAGIKHDLQTIRDTFSLADVPREAYYMGMAGVIPYGLTSLSTVYCAWEIHQATESGSGFLMSEKTAEAMLHVIEPLQVGYGAVIISFLGAIHWGLEWAAYGGTKGYPRYLIGVTATALAWPTILLPVEYALIGQFLVFNFLYYSDSRATKRGWAPPWYAVYRFVLTFIVGASIVVSLIGRGQIADRIGSASGPADRIQHLRQIQAEEFENEEEARRKFLASKDEEEEEEEDEEGGEDKEEDGEDNEEGGEDKGDDDEEKEGGEDKEEKE